MYSEKVMDHFTNPRNMGEIENASGVGTVGNARCGDIMRIYLDIDDNQIIRDCKFKTFGCGEMKEKRELIRVLKIAENEIVLDETGKKNGRGAYLCRSAECFKKAKKSKGLERSLKTAIPEEIYEKLQEEMERIETR